MKNTFFILLIFCTFSIFSQETDIIYRNEEQFESLIWRPYTINVLRLKTDGNYEMKSQEYQSKRMARKNILLYTEIEKGKWNKVKDTLILEEDENKRVYKFLMINNKRLFFIIDNKYRIRTKWKRIKQKNN